MKPLIAAGILILLLLLRVPLLARGIRNNNPGNIKADGTQWNGMIGDDGTFVIFESPFWGLRAMSRAIQNKISRGDNTITKILSQWAPKGENKTDQYIAFTTDRTGLGPDQVISVVSVPLVMEAIVRMENGKPPFGDWYTASQYVEATQKAFT